MKILTFAIAVCLCSASSYGQTLPPDINPVTLTDDEGRTVRIRTPVMDLEGLITPTAVAALSITNATGTPYYGAFSGAASRANRPCPRHAGSTTVLPASMAFASA